MPQGLVYTGHIPPGVDMQAESTHLAFEIKTSKDLLSLTHQMPFFPMKQSLPETETSGSRAAGFRPACLRLNHTRLHPSVTGANKYLFPKLT